MLEESAQRSPSLVNLGVNDWMSIGLPECLEVLAESLEGPFLRYSILWMFVSVVYRMVLAGCLFSTIVIPYIHTEKPKFPSGASMDA